VSCDEPFLVQRGILIRAGWRARETLAYLWRNAQHPRRHYTDLIASRIELHRGDCCAEALKLVRHSA